MECLIHINKACLNCRFDCKEDAPCNEWEPEEINPPFDNLCRGGKTVEGTNELCLDCPNATPNKRKVAKDFHTLNDIADSNESGWARKLPSGWKVKLLADANFNLGRTVSVSAVYNEEGEKIGEVKSETNASLSGDCRCCSMSFKNGDGIESLIREAKDCGVKVERYNETKGFDLLESLVWKLDDQWVKNIPMEWSTHIIVDVNFGDGLRSRIVQVFENGKEIGSVLQWSNNDMSDYGYTAEPFESFEDAFFSLTISVVGEDLLKRRLKI